MFLDAIATLAHAHGCNLLSQSLIFRCGSISSSHLWKKCVQCHQNLSCLTISSPVKLKIEQDGAASESSSSIEAGGAKMQNLGLDDTHLELGSLSQDKTTF